MPSYIGLLIRGIGPDGVDWYKLARSRKSCETSSLKNTVNCFALHITQEKHISWPLYDITCFCGHSRARVCFVLPLSFFMAMLSFFFRIGHLAFYQSMEKCSLSAWSTRPLPNIYSSPGVGGGVLLSSSPTEVNIITFSWFSTYLWRLCAGGGGGVLADLHQYTLGQEIHLSDIFIPNLLYISAPP